MNWKDAYVETIIMHTKEGQELDIRYTQRVEYTFGHIASDAWVVANEDNTPALGAEELQFDFATALKYMKRGLKLYRKSWCFNSDYEGLEYVTVKNSRIRAIYPEDRSYGIRISEEDILAQDWMFYEE